MIKLKNLINKTVEKIPFSTLLEFPRRQRWGAVILLQALFFVIYYFLSYTGQIEAIEEQKKTLSSIQQEIRKYERVSRKIPKLEKEIKSMEDKLKLARTNLPDEKEIPKLLKDVSNIGTKMGLNFITFKPLAEQPEEYYSQVPVSIKVQGGFHNIISFFDQISRMPRIVILSDISIGKAVMERQKTMVTVECLATTFRYVQKNK